MYFCTVHLPVDEFVLWHAGLKQELRLRIPHYRGFLIP